MIRGDRPARRRHRKFGDSLTPEVLASSVALASDWLSENREWVEAGGSGDLDRLVRDLATHLHQHCGLLQPRSSNEPAPLPKDEPEPKKEKPAK